MQETIVQIQEWIGDKKKVPPDSQAIKQLATLDEYAYERIRVSAAQALGLRVGFVDKMCRETNKEED